MYFIYIGKMTTMIKFIVYPIISLIMISALLQGLFDVGHFYDNFRNNTGTKTNSIGKDESQSQIQTVAKYSIIPISFAETSVKPLDIKIKNITADKSLGNNESNFHIVFEIKNPNQNSMLLEGINYDIYSKNHHIISGSIGNQVLNDVVQSQSEFPILGNSSQSLKDMQTIQNGENIGNNLFNNIVKGNTSYLINGTIFYRQTTDIQDTGGIQQFKLVFP
jgi:LEA14-like dessication related protein